MAKKRIGKMIALLTATTLCIATFGACDKEKGSETKESGAKVITTEVLNDFSTEKDLYQVLLLDGYGKMSLNKDEKYYSTGGGSAQLWVADNNGTSMVFKQRLQSDVNDYDYTNFKKAKNVNTSIYNPSEDEVEIVFALEFSDGGRSSIKKFTLNSGWNDLQYAVDREILSLQFDLEKAMYLSYTLENKETPYTVYFDNISLDMTTTEIKEVEQKIDENEICSFDRNYQMSAFSLYTYSSAVMANFTDFGLTANPDRVMSGRAFYVTIKAGMEDSGNSYMLKLNPKYSELIDWKSATENDYISFWVYNDGPAMSLQLRVVNTKGKELMDTKATTEKTEDREAYINKTETKLQAHAWTEVKISFADIQALANDRGYLKEDEKIGDIIKSIDLIWGKFDNVPQKTLYFDEFKIVKGGEAQ